MSRSRLRPGNRKFVSGKEGEWWCLRHECMAIMHPHTMVEDCPFCYAEAYPDHKCDGDPCYTDLAIAAVEDGTAPWMTEHGRKMFREATGRA